MGWSLVLKSIYIPDEATHYSGHLATNPRFYRKATDNPEEDVWSIWKSDHRESSWEYYGSERDSPLGGMPHGPTLKPLKEAFVICEKSFKDGGLLIIKDGKIIYSTT